MQVIQGMRTDDPSYLLRIDGKSGKALWRVERPSPAVMESPDSYTRPAALPAKDTADGFEIVVTGGDVVIGQTRSAAIGTRRKTP